MGFWPVVNDMMRNVDIVVVVADARLPLMSINRAIMDKIDRIGLAYVIAFTKKDLASKDALLEIQENYPGALTLSGTKNQGVKALKEKLYTIANTLKIEEPRIGFVGYPNVGKSALINAMAHRARAKVSNVPGTTRGVQWIKVGGLRVLDSPGVIPFEDKNARLVLLGAKNADMVKSAEWSSIQIIKFLLEKNPEALKNYFKLDSLVSDPYEILLQIGEKRKFLRKGGVVDEDRTSRTIIREWQTGKLRI